MKVISMLIKPASALCNLKCKYCFYIDETKNRRMPTYGVMSTTTVDCIINRVLEIAGGEKCAVNISFQGGEPTLAGIDYFKYFTSKISLYNNLQPTYSIQTNGTLLNEEWSKLFKEHHFLVGISLDGYQENTDLFRLDQHNNGVYDSIMKGIKILEKYNNEYNILTVLTRQLAKNPKRLFQFYLDNHFEFIQIIPCLPELTGNDDGMSLTINEYKDFYIQLFDLWKKELLQGNIISINLFENIASILTSGRAYQCGMNGHCSIQFVIEANGDVFPCDFYCLDEYKLGNIQDLRFVELYQEGLNKFMIHSTCTNEHCKSCKYIKICNGGCRRQNRCYLKDDYCAYEQVLEYIIPQLAKLINNARR